jgi:hypothetical protein
MLLFITLNLGCSDLSLVKDNQHFYFKGVAFLCVVTRFFRTLKHIIISIRADRYCHCEERIDKAIQADCYCHCEERIDKAIQDRYHCHCEKRIDAAIQGTTLSLRGENRRGNPG